jgi:SAM-dependent methyltransferase
MAGENPSGAQPWDASAYDDGHAFVYEYGEALLDLLAPSADDRVLDLGCGTGHLTDAVAAAGASVVGVDRSSEMLHEARAAHPTHPFARADARRLPFEGSFDAVLSNAVLHWVDERDQDAALASVYDALRPGGRFVAELGGTGNVAHIESAVEAELGDRGYEAGDPWHFPSVGEYTARLEGQGFEVRFARLFDRPTELDDGEAGLENWLRMFGEGLLSAVPEPVRTEVRAAVADRLRGELFEDGTWRADYRRLRFVAVRE